MVKHVMPGKELPVFDTDFGRIGIQICFDIGWRDGWKELADKGAQLVIWTSAYDGGNLLHTYAAHNMYYVVSSVRTDHAHTSQVSRCAKIEGKELARYYKSIGYTGLIVTDHFFNGNTIVPADLPWEERMA